MRCLIQNLAFVVAATCVAAASYGAEIIRWETDLETAFRQAQSTNRPLLLHFWTKDCLPCKRLEQTVFSHPRVADSLQDYFIPVKIDADQYPNLAARYGVKSVPKDVIVTPDDQELHRMHSPQDPDQYIAQLSAVAFRANSTAATNLTTERPRSSSLADRSPSDYWGQTGRAPGTADDRYDTDSVYSRANRSASTSLPPYSERDSYRSDRQQQPVDEQPPREVINRFARRGVEEDPRAGESMPTNASRDDDPAAGSRWGAWPRQSAASEVRGEANEEVVENHTSRPLGTESRYASDRESVPGGRASTVLPERGPAAAEPATANPPLGLDGYCAVSLIRKNSWTKGDPRYGVIHRGRTYLFAGPEEKELFFADPDEYSPVLAGVDPVQLSTTGDPVMGERAHGVVYRKRVYLFSSEANLQQFWEEPERYASPIRQAMETGDVNRLFR